MAIPSHDYKTPDGFEDRRVLVGDVASYSLPKPDHKLLHAHPTIGSELLNRISHGDIHPRPNIGQLDGDGVVFADGSRDAMDAIVFCTGNQVVFPFFVFQRRFARNARRCRGATAAGPVIQCKWTSSPTWPR